MSGCARAVRVRTPVVLAYPKAEISTSLAALAARLADAERRDGRDDSFFRRVVRWLN